MAGRRALLVSKGDAMSTRSIALVAGLAVLAVAPAFSQSSDRRNPTPVRQKVFRHAGEGHKVEHFYSVTAGPGQVSITMGMKAKEGASNVDFELFDQAGGKLLYNYMNATNRDEQVTKQVTLRQKQRLVLAVTPDASAAYYSVALDGAIEIEDGEIDVLKLAGERKPLPTTGTLVVALKDGTTQELDLATVDRVTIRP
jgi:hypothetical protein